MVDLYCLLRLPVLAALAEMPALLQGELEEAEGLLEGGGLRRLPSQSRKQAVPELPAEESRGWRPLGFVQGGSCLLCCLGGEEEGLQQQQGRPVPFVALIVGV